MRIFIGALNIANCARNLQHGFRELGHQATVGLEESNKFYSDFTDYFPLQKLREEVRIKRLTDGNSIALPSASFMRFVEKFDLFVFIASSSLLPRMIDLPVLSSLGKDIVSYHAGCDVRDPYLSGLLWLAHGHSHPFHYDFDPPNKPHFADQRLYYRNFSNLLYNVRMAERYATTICSSPAQSNLAIRPYMGIQFPFSADRCTFHIPDNPVPHVIHAPTSRTGKGTERIVQVLDELKAEGLPFTLSILENVPNHVVLEKLQDADVLVDQLVCDCLGGLAFEALASGCAVLSGNSGAVPWPPHRPALSVTPATLKERLRLVLTDRQSRLAAARAGRAWVERFQSPRASARSILNALAKEKRQKFDYYPSLFAQCGHRSPWDPPLTFLQDMTCEILLRHGTHPQTSLKRLRAIGALSSRHMSALSGVARWDSRKMKKLGPWNWCGRHIPEPDFDADRNRWLDEEEALRAFEKIRHLFTTKSSASNALKAMPDCVIELYSRLRRDWRYLRRSWR